MIRSFQSNSISPINATTAWDATVGSPEVLIAVVDTGVYWKHTDFYSRKPTSFPPPSDIASNIYFNSRDPVGDANRDGNLDDDQNGKIDDFVGWDFVDDDNDPSPQPSKDLRPEHGTVIAGVIAARINNSEGVAGVAGQSRILPLRVTTNALGTIESSRIRNAINYAVQINAADDSVRHLILNISLDTDSLNSTTSI